MNAWKASWNGQPVAPRTRGRPQLIREVVRPLKGGIGKGSTKTLVCTLLVLGASRHGPMGGGFGVRFDGDCIAGSLRAQSKARQ